MAAKKRGRRKASKKTSKKVSKKTRRRKATVSVPKASLGNELSILHKIDKKVTRIDRTVNAGRYLARKAKKATRARNIQRAWEDIERHGME